jgi:hypothetical protein
MGLQTSNTAATQTDNQTKEYVQSNRLPLVDS